MVRLNSAVGFVILAGLLSVAQQPKEVSTFSAKTELVVVPVVVTSKGEPVFGLTANDFTIRQDGNPVRVATFEVIDTQPFEIVSPSKLPARSAQNYLPNGNRQQDLVIILLDFLNSSWSSGARIRSYLAEMARQLEEAKAPFAVCVTTESGIVQIQSIGNDPHDFLKAVQAWETGSLHKPDVSEINRWIQPFTPITEVDTEAGLYRYAIMKFGTNSSPASTRDIAAALDLDRAMMTVQAFEQVADAYRGIPGRKKLVWFSIGMPGKSLDFSDWGGPEAMYSTRIAEKSARAIKALSDANIAVYPVDANGVVNPAWEEHFSPANDPLSANKLASRFAEKSTNQPSLMEFADRTGGNMCTLAPDKCLTKAVNDGKYYYVLSFYLGRDTKKGWHKLDVKVHRDNVSVRTRSGFVIGDRTNEHWVQNDMVLTALASPLDYTAIPLNLHWETSQQGGKSTVELSISSPPRGISSDSSNGKLDVDLLAYVRLAGKNDGTSYPASLVRSLTPDQRRTLEANGFRFRKSFELAPGTYEIRVLVRDNVTKNIGTVSAVITVNAATPAP